MNAYERILHDLKQTGRLVSSPDIPPPDLTGVADDSRAVQPGYLFCAVAGTADDGHRYVADAARGGAVAALVTTPQDAALPQVVVDDGRAAAAIAAGTWYDRPGDRLELIGVTGTNGKSTTVALVRHLLNANGDTGAIGTLGAFDGVGAALYREGLTTPGPVALQAALAKLRDAGVSRVVMEVSSHALHQYRVEGLRFTAAVFTNLSHDHLDYHPTLEAYLAAKARLAAYLRPDGILVVNADEPAWRAVPPPARGRRITFGRTTESQMRASAVELDQEETRFRLHAAGDSAPVHLPLVGDFNVSNALAAAATAWGLGAELGAIAVRLSSAPQVPGRLERLHANRFIILRDYAHTPDALERVLVALRPLTTGRLIVLFGCGGDRDRRKRAAMGRIAAEHADLAIVTSDNPRTEDPSRIIQDVEEGMEGRAHVRIVDRREAIAQAVEMLRDRDCLLLAGKGHETYQVVGTERRPFDEPAVVREAVRARPTS